MLLDFMQSVRSPYFAVLLMKWPALHLCVLAIYVPPVKPLISPCFGQLIEMATMSFYYSRIRLLRYSINYVAQKRNLEVKELIRGPKYEVSRSGY